MKCSIYKIMNKLNQYLPIIREKKIKTQPIEEIFELVKTRPSRDHIMYFDGGLKHQEKDQISHKKYKTKPQQSKNYHSEMQISRKKGDFAERMASQKRSRVKYDTETIKHIRRKESILKDQYNQSQGNQIRQFYNQNAKSLKKNLYKLNQLINLININHPFFHKINPIIITSLVKLGFIISYKQSQRIYKNTVKIKNIGFILWGYAYLKKYKQKKKYLCSIGQTLGQQILFQDVDYTLNSNKHILKGQFFTTQSCRAVSDCGVLYIGQEELEIMLQELMRNNFKSDVDKFKNILNRNYLKKRQFRRK